jgi:hypothetical protein
MLGQWPDQREGYGREIKGKMIETKGRYMGKKKARRRREIGGKTSE